MEEMRMDQLLAKEMGVKPKMIWFYALRMIVELNRGKPISKADQIRLFNRSSLTRIQEVFG